MITSKNEPREIRNLPTPPFRTEHMTTRPPPPPTDPAPRNLRFVIIGAGMAGILSAIKLREAGLDDFAVYEKADRLGGTWRENEYPGLSCDVPSHLYSYSFALNPEWSHQFAYGPEIQAYFEDVARRYEVADRIQYGKEITRLEFEFLDQTSVTGKHSEEAQTIGSGHAACEVEPAIALYKSPL